MSELDGHKLGAFHAKHPSIYPKHVGDGDNETDDIWAAYLENNSSKRREITAYAVCR